MGIAGLNHNGASGLSTPLARAAQVTKRGNLAVGMSNLLWQDNWCHGVINTSAYQAIVATATITFSAGYIVFNGGNSVASAAVARLQTYRTFQLNGGFGLKFECRARLALTPVSSNVIEFGFGYAATTVTPTDGVYFKYNASAALQGVTNINGTETTVDLSFTPAANEVYHYEIVVHPDVVEFWINDELYGTISRSASAPHATLAMALPVLIREYNSAGTSSAQRFEMSQLTVSTMDLVSNRQWPEVQAGMELGGYNAPHGATAGQTANYANSAAPASATLSNTAAGYTTLGGQWQFAAVAGAETDYALFAYQVPAGSSVLPGKNLVVRGIHIETFNMGAAVATTTTTLQWGLGIGSTAVSLATADSASAGTRAPRRLALGAQSLPVAAAIGATATPVDVKFTSPLYVAAGTFIHVILKMPVGTATASQIVRGVVAIDATFE